MPTTARRAQRHAATREELKDAARRLMAAHGTAGLGLRAVAREVGLSAPALYTYFPRHEDLLTALIVDAFNALAAAVEQAGAAAVAAGRPPAECLLAALLAYRAWALAHPVDFQLIYGNPVPGYEAPAEITVPAAARSLYVIVTLMAAALKGRPAPRVPAALRAPLAALREQGGFDAPLSALYVTVTGWPRIHGVIMLELFGHLQPVVGDVETFYRLQVEDLLKEKGVTR